MTVGACEDHYSMDEPGIQVRYESHCLGVGCLVLELQDRYKVYDSVLVLGRASYSKGNSPRLKVQDVILGDVQWLQRAGEPAVVFGRGAREAVLAGRESNSTGSRLEYLRKGEYFLATNEEMLFYQDSGALYAALNDRGISRSLTQPPSRHMSLERVAPYRAACDDCQAAKAGSR
jgi:hypothetical protein